MLIPFHLILKKNKPMEKAYVAAGCFWGVQYHLEKEPGVTDTSVGFMGGHVESPSYMEVVRHGTGHLETVEITYDPAQVSYEHLVKVFFEIHDFTQTNGQGPDIGEQYLSAIFYTNDEQKHIAEKIKKELEEKGYAVATTIRKADTFWEAEDYHQHYYDKNGKEPYCHIRKKIFS